MPFFVNLLLINFIITKIKKSVRKIYISLYKVLPYSNNLIKTLDFKTRLIYNGLKKTERKVFCFSYYGI